MEQRYAEILPGRIRPGLLPQADPGCDDPAGPKVFVDVLLRTAIKRKSRSQRYVLELRLRLAVSTQRGGGGKRR